MVERLNLQGGREELEIQIADIMGCYRDLLEKTVVSLSLRELVDVLKGEGDSLGALNSIAFSSLQKLGVGSSKQTAEVIEVCQDVCLDQLTVVLYEISSKNNGNLPDELYAFMRSGLGLPDDLMHLLARKLDIVYRQYSDDKCLIALVDTFGASRGLVALGDCDSRFSKPAEVGSHRTAKHFGTIAAASLAALQPLSAITQVVSVDVGSKSTADQSPASVAQGDEEMLISVSLGDSESVETITPAVNQKESPTHRNRELTVQEQAALKQLLNIDSWDYKNHHIDDPDHTVAHAFGYFMTHGDRRHPHGFSAVEAAGILGSLIVEADAPRQDGLNPRMKQYEGGSGRGIAQWTRTERWQDLITWANRNKLDPYELDTQLGFIIHEMNHGYERASIALSGAQDAREAAIAFERHYEKAGSPNNNLRADYAQMIFNAFNRKLAAVTAVKPVAAHAPTSASPPPQTRATSTGEKHSIAGADRLGFFKGPNGQMIELYAIKGLPSSSEESNRKLPNGRTSKYYIEGADGHAIVRAEIAARVVAMVEAAKADGVELGALSSFRTFDHQKQLCNENTLCRNGNTKFVAKAGKSPHNSGEAIDFTILGGSVKNCVWEKGVCTAPHDKEYNWLVKNAARFGFEQYENEAWHWEAKKEVE
jgi:hypothetical protein